MSNIYNRRAYLDGYRKRHPKPVFDFKEIPATIRLYYEMVDENNYQMIYKMFHNDNNIFVIKEFKDTVLFEEYMNYQLNYNKYALKHAGCNWFIKRKTDNAYLGVLHLFELSTESFNDNNRKCFIGFNIKKEFRGQYYAYEAIMNFINYIFASFSNIRIILARARKTNIPSSNLLLKGGFKKTKSRQYRHDSLSEKGLFFYFRLNKK